MGVPHDDAVAPTLAADTPATAPTLAAGTPATAPTLAAGTPATAPTLAAPAAPRTSAVLRPGPDRPAADGQRYDIGALLGRGGMGEVRIARDERVGRDVAVKTLVAGATPPAPAAVARFLREARVQGRLDHPAIVPVHDLGFDEHGVPFFVMKRLAGTTLADILARQAAGDRDALARWPRRTLLARLADVCLAVEFAHARGVIHRDLKPHNIMLGDFGEVHVLDWGIARIGDDEPASGTGIQRSDLDTLDSVVGATADGAVLGTPGYMAPEQARGGAIDARADVYALGCILFELLALEPLAPRGAPPLETALHASAGHPAARRPDRDIAPELDQACARATAPDPAARTPSAAALHAAIQRYLDGDRDLARRRELAGELVAQAETELRGGDRAQAMRAAGRALALDPDHDGAAELVGRLLLEPPAETPAAVLTSLERTRVVTSQSYLRVASLAYLAYLMFLPALLWLGVKDWTVPSAIAAMAIGNALFTYVLARQARPIGRWLILALFSDGALVLLVSACYSPLMMVPGLATASALTFIGSPARPSPIPILITTTSAMLVPLALEGLGVLPRTFSIDDAGIHIRSWVMGSDPTATLVVLIAGNLGLLFVVAHMAIKLRRAQDAADLSTHLTAWHLRQLVPEREP